MLACELCCTSCHCHAVCMALPQQFELDRRCASSITAMHKAAQTSTAGLVAGLGMCTDCCWCLCSLQPSQCVSWPSGLRARRLLVCVRAVCAMCLCVCVRAVATVRVAERAFGGVTGSRRSAELQPRACSGVCTCVCVCESDCCLCGRHTGVTAVAWTGEAAA